MLFASKKILLFVLIVFFVTELGSLSFAQETKTYKRILREGVAVIDPLVVTEANAYQLLSQVAEGLVSYYDYQIMPAIAERWEVSKDLTEYTFYLNPKARFSDGSLITVNDVLGSFNKILSHKNSYYAKEFITMILGAQEYSEGKVASVSGLIKKSDSVLVIKLKKPFSLLLDILSTVPFSILPKTTIEQLSKREKVKPFVGSGPYYLETINNKEVVLAKNKYYHSKDTVDFDFVHYDIVNDFEKAKQDFLLGKYNDVWPIFFKTDISKQHKNIRKIPSYAMITWFLSLNKNSESVVKDINFRKFIAGNLDREAFLKEEKLPVHYKSKSLIPRGMLGFTPNEPVKEKQNPELLLEKTDCTKKEPCQIEIITQHLYVKALERLIEPLKKYKDRVNVTIKGLDRVSFYERTTNQDYQIFYGGFFPEYYDTFCVFKYFVTDSQFLGVKTPEIESLLEKALSNENKIVRAELYSKVDALIAKDHLVLPIYHGRTANLYVLKGVQGYYVPVLGTYGLKIKDLIME